MSEQKRIEIIHTGGTIGGASRSDTPVKMRPDWETELRDVLSRKAEIAHEYALTFKTPMRLFSEKMIPSDWIDIARAIATAIRDHVHGIVVTHGTDTMPFTVAAVSFMLRGIQIPVVFTGARRPLSHPDTDAIQNLFHSLLVAGCRSAQGIYVVFPNRRNVSTIYIGTRIRQIQPFQNTFDTLAGGIVGYVKDDNGLVLDQRRITASIPKENFTVSLDICDKVASFHVYPGFDPWFVRAAVDGGARGVLLHLYHSGTGCTREADQMAYSLIPAIQYAKSKGAVLFFVPTPVSAGKRFLYPASQELTQAGAIGLPPMTWEAAVVKLMWALGQSSETSEVERLMLRNIAGEICLASMPNSPLRDNR